MEYKSDLDLLIIGTTITITIKIRAIAIILRDSHQALLFWTPISTADSCYLARHQAKPFSSFTPDCELFGPSLFSNWISVLTVGRLSTENIKPRLAAGVVPALSSDLALFHWIW